MSQGRQNPSPNVLTGSQRFRELLSEALKLADALELPPEIGARLQEVIDLVDITLDSAERSVDEGPPADMIS